MTRDLLRHLAAETGEVLWAVDDARLSAAERAPATASAGIAIVPLMGVLVPRTISTWFGRFPGLDAFRANLSAAAANRDVGAIVLDVNSPGGAYASTPETAALVREIAQVKPVIAMIDALCASAAYMIASQATEIVVTPSGEGGSIGVMAVHVEQSKMMEDIGLKATVFRSRASKGSMNPYEPLTDDARAAMQASVDEADGVFLKAVGQGRNMTVAQVRQVVDDNGLGRVIGAKQLVSLGLADRVATMGQVLTGMVKKTPAKRRSALVFD